MSEKITKKTILEIDFVNESEEKVLEYVVNFINHQKGKLFITTPNPEILVYAKHHKDFFGVLQHADISLPDGIGVFMASVILGKSLRNRITGVDFMKNLCKKASEQPITVGFLGGKGAVAQQAADCLKQQFPKLQILLAEAGNPDAKTAKMITDNFGKKQQLDILFVGYGFPRQEQWIYDNIEKLPVRVAMTVGGAFDIVSGSLPRAPKILRAVGLEWLWRLILEPKRITRQVKLLEFVGMVVSEYFKR
jgi:N-acetylglucosaminyldiphosphoundecaprenol N-acetyl-beta-D-mannosaminyltransferase